MSDTSETDEVMVDPTDTAQVETAVEAALAAVAASGDLDDLKRVRSAHTGDKSPLALANRAIGKLDKAQKSVAGQLIGPARGRINKAIAAREIQLAAERNARVLAQERVAVTLPFDRRPPGARHPISAVMEDVQDIFVAMGWEV